MEKKKFTVAILLPVVVKYAVPAVWDVVRSRVEPPEEKDLWREKMCDGQDWAPEPGWSPCPAQRAAGLCLGSGGSPALPGAPSPGPRSYRGKFICQVREHSFWGQQSGVSAQLVKIAQKREFITLTPCPGSLQGFIHHPSSRGAPFQDRHLGEKKKPLEVFEFACFFFREDGKRIQWSQQ